MSRRSRRLVIASNNRHKIAELAQMLAAAEDPAIRELEVVSASGVGFGEAPDIEETSDQFVGNAVLKADGIAAWLRSHGAPSDDLVLADDSGLCVDVLDGAPGVYSARFAGFHADDESNNTKLITELQARSVDASEAHYVCVLAVRKVAGEGQCTCIEGRCGGTVRIERRGTGGFGYDPHFWLGADDPNGDRTFAELSPSEKSQRSHRGAAMRILVDELPVLLM